MRLNVGMMVDGNSRFAFIEVMRRNGLTAADLEYGVTRDDLMGEYAACLREIYVENARWCVHFGEEILSRTEDSDYSIFIYNVANRARDHFSCIDNAVRTVGGELTERLGKHGPVCAVGPEKEKENWFSLFPEWRELESPGEGNRTVLLTGYQQETGEDPRARLMRPIDYFIRSTQMRFSGMYLPALANSHFLVFSHIPYMYSPRRVAEAIMEQAEADEEHDSLNVYSARIYAEWLRHYKKTPEIYFTSNALPPSAVEFPPEPQALGPFGSKQSLKEEKAVPARLYPQLSAV